jgi:hypothetical protein
VQASGHAGETVAEDRADRPAVGGEGLGFGAQAHRVMVARGRVVPLTCSAARSNR